MSDEMLGKLRTIGSREIKCRTHEAERKVSDYMDEVAELCVSAADHIESLAAQLATVTAQLEYMREYSKESREQLAAAQQQSEAEAVAYSALSAEHARIIEQLAAAQSRLAEVEADANRYRYLRRKVCIIQRSGFMGTQADKYADFELINFPKPTYMAPDAACELDAAIDQQITDEEYDALAYN